MLQVVVSVTYDPIGVTGDPIGVMYDHNMCLVRATVFSNFVNSFRGNLQILLHNNC